MRLETLIDDIHLRNPLILASGVLGTSYSSLERLYKGGLGAVVTKSIGPKPRDGNPNPSVFFLSEINSAVNSVGLANPGYKAYKEEIEILVKNSIPTIVSIFGGNVAEFIEVLEGLDDISFLGFELNLSCPNTEKEGLAVGTDPELVYSIVHELRKRTTKPLWVKLTPNITNINEVAEAAIKGGCSALVAINTLKAMVIDIYSRKPVLGYKRGGLSGAAIKPIGVRYVYDLYEQFGKDVPIIGVGGISSGHDIVEYLLAGASAVEIGTAIGVAYPENKVKFFKQQIRKYMVSQEVESISDLIGGAHRA
ncbi:MAG: dihydroorotate dehydrogenase [Candidatus Heimdallarchaeaceae archaeon]